MGSVKGLLLRLLLPLLALLALAPASAATELRELDVRVLLNDDGSARIVQTWNARVSDEGTEFFIEQGNLGDMELSDFSVRELGGPPYINEGARWRTDRSAAEKAGRCGIVRTRGGLELCWGRGPAGPRTFVVSWTFSNFVKAYDDYDGFNVRLVNSGLSTPPRALRITIEKPGRPFASGEVDLWAFGFRGTIRPEGGKIVARSDAPLTASNYATVMLRFAKGVFNPSSVVRGRFEAVEKRALEGTEDGEEDWDGIVAFLICILVALYHVVLGFVRKGRRARSPRFPHLPDGFGRTLRNAPYFREIPCGGDLSESWALLGATSFAARAKDLVGAYFLRWVQHGALEPVTGASGTALHVRGRTVPEGGGLFAMLREAAGPDGILQREEFPRWGRNEANRRAFGAWLEAERTAGMERFRARGGWELRTTTSFWVRHFLLGPRRPFSAPFVTSSGEQTLLELAGFRRYLQDFTLVNERRVVEVELWNDYLVFAALFGIGKELLRELVGLYPEFAARSVLAGAGGTLLPTVLDLSDSLTVSLSRRSGGGRYDSRSGGRSFGGGGGGSSGGGSRGGVR